MLRFGVAIFTTTTRTSLYCFFRRRRRSGQETAAMSHQNVNTHTHTLDSAAAAARFVGHPDVANFTSLPIHDKQKLIEKNKFLPEKI